MCSIYSISLNLLSAKTYLYSLINGYEKIWIMVKMLTLLALTLSTEIMERLRFILIPAINTCSCTVFGIQLDHSLLSLSFLFCDFFPSTYIVYFATLNPLWRPLKNNVDLICIWISAILNRDSHFSVNLFILATLYVYFPSPKKIPILIQVSSIGGENFSFSSLFLDFLLDF